MAHIGVAPGSKLTDAIRKVHADATRRRRSFAQLGAGRGDGAAAAAVAKRRSVRRREAPLARRREVARDAEWSRGSYSLLVVF